MKGIEFTPQCHYARHIPNVRPIQTLALVISALQTHGSRLSWVVYGCHPHWSRFFREISGFVFYRAQSRCPA